MASLRVEQVIHQIEDMTLQEQEEIREAIERLLGATTPPDPLQRRLMEAGLLLRPGNPAKRAERLRGFQPVQVEGEPVSETIIKERR